MPDPTPIITYVMITRPRWRGLQREESDVMTLIAYGFSREEICQDLGISMHSLYRRRRTALAALNLRNDAEIVRHAIAHHYIAIPTERTCVRGLVVPNAPDDDRSASSGRDSSSRSSS